MQHSKLRLIGYLRSGGTRVFIDEQRLLIRHYCQQHGHTMVGFTDADTDAPGLGLQQALKELKRNDGIIALNLNCFVKNVADRLLDLRPMVENMIHEKKVLITLEEGIDSQTAYGQQLVLDLLSEWSERESVMTSTLQDHHSPTNAY